MLCWSSLRRRNISECQWAVTLVCDGTSSRFFIIKSDLYLGRGNALLYVCQQFNDSYSKSFCISAFGYQKKKISLCWLWLQYVLVSCWPAKKKTKKKRDSFKDGEMDYQISAAVLFLQSQIYLSEGLSMVILYILSMAMSCIISSRNGDVRQRD